MRGAALLANVVRGGASERHLLAAYPARPGGYGSSSDPAGVKVETCPAPIGVQASFSMRVPLVVLDAIDPLPGISPGSPRRMKHALSGHWGPGLFHCPLSILLRAGGGGAVLMLLPEPRPCLPELCGRQVSIPVFLPGIHRRAAAVTAQSPTVIHSQPRHQPRKPHHGSPCPAGRAAARKSSSCPLFHRQAGHSQSRQSPTSNSSPHLSQFSTSPVGITTAPPHPRLAAGRDLRWGAGRVGAAPATSSAPACRAGSRSRFRYG